MGRLISQSVQMHDYINSIKPHWILQWFIYCTTLKDATPSLPVVHNMTHHRMTGINQAAFSYLRLALPGVAMGSDSSGV